MYDFINLYTPVTGGSLSIVTTGTNIDVYTRVIVQGDATSATVFTINGTQMNLAGGTTIDFPSIKSLSVQSGAGVIVIGYKQRTEIFGNP